MNRMKILLWFVAASAIFGLYIIGFQPSYLPQALAQYHQPVRTNVDKSANWVTQLVNNIKSSQLKPFGEVVQTSEIVGVDTNTQKTLPQKALEYGRYQYCQQVVKEYEEAQSKAKSASPTPSPEE